MKAWSLKSAAEESNTAGESDGASGALRRVTKGWERLPILRQKIYAFLTGDLGFARLVELDECKGMDVELLAEFPFIES